MSDLGDLLKKARTTKGLSLEELQELTKIRKRYLEAIEDGNFKALPGNFYVRAFIKSYAETVGLDPEEILQLYQNVIPPKAEEPRVEIKTPMSRKRRSINTDKWTKLATAFLMICFFLLIVTLIYYYFYSSDNGGANLLKNPPITEKTETLEKDSSEKGPGVTDPELEPKEPVVEEKPPEPEVTYVNTDGTTDIYTATHAKNLNVEIKVTGEECWIRIKKGNVQGEDLKVATYTNGRIIQQTLDDSLYIRLGNAQAVEINVNGTVLNKFDVSDPRNVQINLVKSEG